MSLAANVGRLSSDGGNRKLHVGDVDVEKAGTAKSDDTIMSEGGADNSVIDWDGPNDPEKPLNWSPQKKWVNILAISSLTLLTPFGSSMFAPAIPQVMEEFGTSNATLGILAVSIYVLGYAFGPLILAPVSEMYGRLVLYHSTTIVFILVNVACARSTNMPMLVVFRFIAGLIGSCPLTLGPGSISDCFKQEERGFVIAIWTLPILLGPAVGPVAGGYMTEYLGWRSDFWFLVIAPSIAWIVCLIVLRETYPPVLLQRRTDRLRKETGNTALRSALQTTKRPRVYLLTSIIRPTKMLLLSPVVSTLAFYTATNYGLLYLLFTTTTEVFQEQYGFNASSAGLTFLGGGVGQVLGLIEFGFASDKLLLHLAKGGEKKPEHRLPPAIIGAFLVPLGFLWYGWTLHYRCHWILPVIGTFWIGLGMILIFTPVAAYLVDSFPQYAASAAAANTVLRSLGGALLPLCGSKMYDALGLGWGNSLLALIGIALIPAVVLFYNRGERIRTHPRFQLEL